MTRGRDDDALSWGDDDPTLDVGASNAARDATLGLPDGFHAVGNEGSAAVSEQAPVDQAAVDQDPVDHTTADQAPSQIGNAALIFLGVFGGIYLLYTIGWIAGGIRLRFFSTLASVPDAAYYSSFVLAVAAPLIWFLATLLLTRGRRQWIRIAWLAAGVVLLVPWPFLMVGVIGQ